MKINYKELTDEELALLGKNGDSQAVNELLLRYKAHAKEGCKKYFVAGGDLEDLAQEGLIAVYRAINTYKEGMDFKSYAKKCMKNAWISAIRKSNSGKNKPLNNYLSISGDDDNEIDKSSILVSVEPDPAETVVATEEYKELDEKIKAELSVLEYQILQLMIKGFTYQEMAKEIGKEVKAVDNAVQRIKKKVTKCIK